MKTNNKIKLIKTQPFYKVELSSSKSLWILAKFLTQEANNIGSYKWYRKWLKNGSFAILGNAYELNAHGNTKILVNEQEFLSGKSEPGENDPFVFVTTRKQLIVILDQWINIISCQPKPHEIDIIQENDGSITFKAFDSKGNEIEIEQDETVKEKIISFFGTLKKKFLSRRK